MYEVIQGGVTAAKGFMAAFTAAGIKYKNRPDMAMIYSQVPCESAGTFTTASGGKEHTVYRQRIQQCRTGSYVQFLVAIDSQFYITRRHQEILGNQQDNNKQDDNHEEYSNAC